jgi:hypothetical protein
MQTIFRFKSALTSVAVAATLACNLAAAAAPATPVPARVRATIDAVSADSVDVTVKGGKHQTLKLAPDAKFMGVSLTDVGDIKSDSFIGSAAIPQPDGTLKALEVHVFPAGMKSGEGSYDWDLTPKSTMTNGTVGSVVVSSGRTITVKYPNGEKKIVIPADVPIVRLEPGDRSLLVKGAHAVFFTKTEANGSLTVTRGSVGKNGVVPPM